MTSSSFVDRFAARAANRSRLCVGIDPDEKTLASWDLPVSAEGARVFGLKLVDAVGGEVAIFKPQIAFFERFGPAGFAALAEVNAAIKAQGALILSDVKRLDIDSTFAAYASAWLGDDAGFPSDAITIGAYTGTEAINIVLQRAASVGAGVFVLVR